MPGSADVSHHPFQAEMDELIACVLEGRDTSIDVFDAQKTMEVCLAADRSAERGGVPVCAAAHPGMMTEGLAHDHVTRKSRWSPAPAAASPRRRAGARR